MEGPFTVDLASGKVPKRDTLLRKAVGTHTEEKTKILAAIYNRSSSLTKLLTSVFPTSPSLAATRYKGDQLSNSNTADTIIPQSHMI